MKKGWWKSLPENLINSATVAGIAFLSLLSVGEGINRKSVSAAGVASGLTFLIELRKFLDLNKR